MYNVTIFSQEPGFEYRTTVKSIYDIKDAIKVINESRPDIVVLIGDVAIRCGDFKALAAKWVDPDPAPEEVKT